MSFGEWMPAHVRAHLRGWPRFSFSRLQISFDGGENQRTFWVLFLGGWAFSFAIPSWLANRILGGANSSGKSVPS